MSARLSLLGRSRRLVDRPAPDLAVGLRANFASGTNQAGQIRAFGDLGLDVGAAVPELREPALRAPESLAGKGVAVFVDSGAFSEVKFGADGPRVVKPLGPDHWERVFRIYERLAAVLGSQLWVVAPDKVGYQRGTLRRLRRYRERVVGLLDSGANVLVALQKGATTQATFAAQVDLVLGRRNWVAAVPARKGATSPTEIAELLDARPLPHLHLLGRGPRSRSIKRYLAPFAGRETTVSLDACWVTQNVGRDNGRKVDPAESFGGRRRFTIAKDLALELLGPDAGADDINYLSVHLSADSALAA